MKKIDRRIVIAFTSIIIISLSYGIMQYLIAQKEDPKQRPPMEIKRFVKTAPVSYSNISSPVSGSGRLASTSQIDLVAEASGKIEVPNIPLKKGGEFSKGDLLFTIYPEEVKLALKARKSQFLNNLANCLPDIHIDFPEYETDFRSFFNSICLDKDLPAFPEFESEKLKIYLAGKNLSSEYYSIKKDELQLKRHSVYAPFTGTYTEVNMEAGAYTNIGGKVAKIIRTDILELEVPVEKQDAKWIEIGDDVTVVSTSRKLEWKGRIIRKGQFVDPNTQSQSVFIQLTNKKNQALLVGEYLSATFKGSQIEEVMEIPRNAVFNSNEVFVVINGLLEKRTINPIKWNETTVLFNGINKGEMIVLQPLINVLEGTAVEINKEVFLQDNSRKQATGKANAASLK